MKCFKNHNCCSSSVSEILILVYILQGLSLPEFPLLLQNLMSYVGLCGLIFLMGSFQKIYSVVMFMDTICNLLSVRGSENLKLRKIIGELFAIKRILYIFIYMLQWTQSF